MTNNEIIKALECCLHSGERCNKCELNGFHDCIALHPKDILDLINRQKETIQNQDEMIRALINAQETLQKEIEKLKSGHILYDSEE